MSKTVNDSTKHLADPTAGALSNNNYGASSSQPLQNPLAAQQRPQSRQRRRDRFALLFFSLGGAMLVANLRLQDLPQQGEHMLQDLPMVAPKHRDLQTNMTRSGTVPTKPPGSDANSERLRHELPQQGDETVQDLPMMTPKQSGQQINITRSGMIPTKPVGSDTDTGAGENPTGIRPRSPFAYAFLIGGCHPEQGEAAYRNYLYNVLVSTRCLRMTGSTQDVVLFVQMSKKSTKDELPRRDVGLLEALDIRVRYIAKEVSTDQENFYSLTIKKLLVLTLTEYRRVLFLDSDNWAIRSMDYIFQLSEKGKLRENMIVAGVAEPANAGFFMLKPEKGAWQRVQQIVRSAQERGRSLPWPHWDVVKGWGHAIEQPDYYENMFREKGNNWTFYCAYSDQGLLYHWVKYEQKSVSIVRRNEVIHWIPGGDGAVRLQETTKGVFNATHTREKKPIRCYKGYLMQNPCMEPFSDYVHFTGRKKPWLSGPSEKFFQDEVKEGPKEAWFDHLSKLNEELSIGLNLSQWEKDKRPPLGFHPSLDQIRKAISSVA